MLQNAQLALAGVIVLFALIHLIPIIDPTIALGIVWIFAVGYGLVLATNIVMAGGLPLLWYFTKLSFTDNV